MTRALIRSSAIVGALGVAITALGLIVQSRAAYFAWLTAFTFWLSLALGALLFIMIQHAMSGTWFIVFRRIAEACMIPLVVLAALFVPLLLGIREIYPWADQATGSVELAGGRRTWFDLPFFLIRAVAYFASWLAASALLSRWSLRQQDGDAVVLAQKQRVLSAAMLPLVGFTASFAAFDWLMSLDPAWYSTIFGVYFLSGAVLGFLSLLAVVSHQLIRRGMTPDVSISHTHGLGKLLLVVVVFWAYIAYAQYFLIWIADVPEEVGWYYVRSRNGWGAVGVLLIIAHFGIPLMLLLSRRVKRSPRSLAMVGVWLLVLHYIDLYWIIMPILQPERPHPSLYDVTALAGFGGLFVATASWWLKGRALVPSGDPRLSRSLSFQTS